MLLERKERSPTHEDATVAAIKNIREICKFLVCHYLSLLLILLQIKLTFARKILHLPVASFWKCKCLELGNDLFKFLKAMLHETIRNEDFRHITLQCRIVVTLFQSLTTSIQHSCSKDPRCNSFSISYSGRCTKKKDRLLWISKIAKTKVSLAFTAILQVHNIMALVSVKIFGTLYCLLALLMVVHKIWWVNCDKPYWEGEMTGQEEKKQRPMEVSQLFCLGLTWTWQYQRWPLKAKMLFTPLLKK